MKCPGVMAKDPSFVVRKLATYEPLSSLLTLKSTQEGPTALSYALSETPYTLKVRPSTRGRAHHHDRMTIDDLHPSLRPYRSQATECTSQCARRCVRK